MDTDRNLLFAVLALQADLLDRDRFIGACSLWAARKDTPIADLLVAEGWLSPAHRAVVEQLIEAKLRKHGGDAHKSLAEARGALTDAEAQRSLAALTAPPGRRDGLAAADRGPARCRPCHPGRAAASVRTGAAGADETACCWAESGPRRLSC